MILFHLLLIFLGIPAALFALAALTPVSVRFWLLFAAFPASLILFALWRYLHDRHSVHESVEDRS